MKDAEGEALLDTVEEEEESMDKVEVALLEVDSAELTVEALDVDTIKFDVDETTKLDVTVVKLDDRIEELMELESTVDVAWKLDVNSDEMELALKVGTADVETTKLDFAESEDWLDVGTTELDSRAGALEVEGMKKLELMETELDAVGETALDSELIIMVEPDEMDGVLEDEELEWLVIAELLEGLELKIELELGTALEETVELAL